MGSYAPGERALWVCTSLLHRSRRAPMALVCTGPWEQTQGFESALCIGLWGLNRAASERPLLPERLSLDSIRAPLLGCKTAPARSPSARGYSIRRLQALVAPLKEL